MESFQFGNPWALYIGFPLLVAVGLYRLWWYKPTLYRYTLVHFFKAHLSSRSYGRALLFVMRSVALVLCVLLMARPQLVDTNSQLLVEGVDIMLVLDVSGSMQLFDDLQDRRQRIQVAKQEAIKFVDKRPHDPIGLVIFGAYAVSRCPVTLDKKMLKQIIGDLTLDTIDARGTALSVAIATGANRLRGSKAKSKIMILLTDGEPTPELDIDPDDAIAIVKKLGIKIYTVGIGAQDGGFVQDPVFGIRRMGSTLNKQLLTNIAQQTGGAFFHAQKPEDMARIYDTIDRLEKTEIETTLFTKYRDLLFPWIWILVLLFGAELLARAFIWFGISV